MESAVLTWSSFALTLKVRLERTASDAYVSEVVSDGQQFQCEGSECGGVGGD